MKFKNFGKALLMSALSAAVALSITSCTQSYSVGYLYVTGTVTAQPSGNGIITGFKIDHNTGKLTPIPGLPVSSGGANPVRAWLISGQRFLYVLNRGVSDNPAGSSVCTYDYPCKNSNITQFAVGGNGILTPQATFYTQGVNPFRLTGDGSGKFLLVLDHDSPDPTSTSSNPVPSASNASCSAALTGATSCGDITVFQIDPTTGRLELVVNAQVTAASGSALPYFPIPVNPIDFLLTGGTLLTMSGTPTTGDSVFPLSYNGTTGQLTVSQNSSQPLNANNATAIVSGSSYVYVLDNDPITYVPAGQTSAVTAPSRILPFTLGSNGALQAQTGGAVPDDPTLANPVAIAVKGNWVYVANAGLNVTSSGLTQTGLAGYIIDPSSHQLTVMPGEPFGTGDGPQCLVIDPSNQFIYEANFNDSTVTGQSIDQNAGVLDPFSQTTHAPASYTLTGPATWCLVDGRTS